MCGPVVECFMRHARVHGVSSLHSLGAVAAHVHSVQQQMARGLGEVGLTKPGMVGLFCIADAVPSHLLARLELWMYAEPDTNVQQYKTQYKTHDHHSMHHSFPCIITRSP